ncbi:MAG: FAD-binding protein [Thermoanaerobaculia bacterium]
MFNRRDFLKAAGLLAFSPAGRVRPGPQAPGLLVNDVHSQLNPTRVDRIVSADSLETIRMTLRRAQRDGKAISIAGGRHAMGGQQFGLDAVLLDMRPLNRVLHLDAEKGLVEVEAGIQWPQLVDWLLTAQVGRTRQWGIAQKQTGADRLSLGGGLAANVHGRGLTMKPMISDVEAFDLIDASGEARRCSRSENPELFRLCVGGYGLFGAVTSVRLRLTPRQKVERIVEILTVNDLMSAFQRRIADGFLYGDFQFAINEKSEDFLRKGVFSCYRPVDPATPVPANQRELSEQDWERLLYLAHTNREEAFQAYARHYLATSGQIYWSDTHQMSTYLDDYHKALDRRLGTTDRATEMITEIYVPREALAGLLNAVRDDFRQNGVELIYGTVRLIEPDKESFLAWARQPYACVIFNLHVVHTVGGLARAAAAFRRLIDLGIERGGSYYLTYHRYATREQVLACYPQFPEFLRLKRKYDPRERFQSDWYRHYKTMFADELTD